MRKEVSMAFRESSIKALTDLGLNNLEANIYLALLSEPGTTGYRVAKSLGKPVSNVYHSLESLTGRGLVILRCHGKDRLFSPVPVKEMTSLLRSDLERKVNVLEDELKAIEAPPLETAIYEIDNREQLFNKISTLIREANRAVLFTADGFFINQFKPELETAAENGRTVLILGYEDIELTHCDFLKLTSCNNTPWPGHWIIMDVDGIQHLIAFFEKPDTLTHAIWCNDQYVSYWIHFFMLADFTLMTFFEETRNRPEYKEIHDRINGIYRKYTHYNLKLTEYYTSFTWMRKDPSAQPQADLAPESSNP